jgi:hypothetical protein
MEVGGQHQVPCLHWIGGWVGPEAGLDCRKKKSLSMAVYAVAPRYTNCVILALKTNSAEIVSYLL